MYGVRTGTGYWYITATRSNHRKEQRESGRRMACYVWRVVKETERQKTQSRQARPVQRTPR